MGFEETELRLGLPGNGGGGGGGGEGELARKRGFAETVDLKLNLSSKEAENTDPSDKTTNSSLHWEKNLLSSADPAKPQAKAQVVGWPPVQSFRKNMLTVRKSSTDQESEKRGGGRGSRNNNNAAATFVKVSMEGAPYLRKVDLKMYKTYQELSDALGNLLSSFTIGSCGSQGMKDLMNESKLMDLLNSTDYVPTYEDKDGDWMLVGDVPWEMFVQSCKRLRIMKGTDATGLAPLEKCKNRSFK